MNPKELEAILALLGEPTARKAAHLDDQEVLGAFVRGTVPLVFLSADEAIAAYTEWLASRDRKVAAAALRTAATGFLDWDVVFGHEPTTPAAEEGFRAAEYLERQARGIEAGE